MIEKTKDRGPAVGYKAHLCPTENILAERARRARQASRRDAAETHYYKNENSVISACVVGEEERQQLQSCR